jgi:aspartate dehydrogenase
MRIGLIGCGNIGVVLAKAINEGKLPNVKLVCVYDRNRRNAESLVGKVSEKPVIVENIKEFFEHKVELVVEAASPDALNEYVIPILREGIGVLAMSVGALLDEKVFKEALKASIKSGAKVYVPSGAIAGLDGLKSASVGGIDEVSLVSIKPKASFAGNEYLKDKKIDLDALKEELIVFEGCAKDAVKFFPKTINVCAALSIAGLGSDKTKVKIIADPNTQRIKHIINVSGAFGELEVKVSNIPSPDNPRTSYLAALSAIATLKKLSEGGVIVGT